MMAVPGTEELYSFETDLLISYFVISHFLQKTTFLRALQLTEAITKPVHLKEEPNAPLFKFSLRNEFCLHFVSFCGTIP